MTDELTFYMAIVALVLVAVTIPISIIGLVFAIVNVSVLSAGFSLAGLCGSIVIGLILYDWFTESV